MFHSFLESQEEGGMEYWVDLPSGGNVKVESHVRDNFFCFEQTSLFHLELLGSIHIEVCCF